MNLPRKNFDLAIVGAGIVGLGCALAAAWKGLRVVVIERDEFAKRASIRNFGFITVTGQERRQVWSRALRSRDVWREVAPLAGIPLVQTGQWIVAQRPEAAAVAEAFLRTEMGEGCEILSATSARHRCPNMTTPRLQCVLSSSHELRVESREAIPKLTGWLEREHGVTFCWKTAVRDIDLPTVATSRGPVNAAAVIVCPGDDLVTLFPDHLASAGRCTLQMMRLESPGFSLPGTVTSDLTLARYSGFADLPEADALSRRLKAEQAEYYSHGIHLIVAQAGDGSLVVGDSHHYDSSTEPFAEERIHQLLRDEYQAVMGRPAPATREVWTGTYAADSSRPWIIETPAPGVRLAVVTSGIGASIGFALGEEIVGPLFS